MKKKYKCMSCCKEVNKPKSFGGVDGHCRPGDLAYNNNDLFAAIENVDNISAEIISDDRQLNSNVIGYEYHIVLWPYQTKKRVGSIIRYGKYKARVIDNERRSSSNHQIRIIRELSDFEKLILILKKDYLGILYSFSKRNVDLIRELYPQSLFSVCRYILRSEISSIKYSIKYEDFSHRYDNR